MKYDNIIAIDPDKEKSGVAFLKPKTRQLEVSNLTFPMLLDYLQHAKKGSGRNDGILDCRCGSRVDCKKVQFPRSTRTQGGKNRKGRWGKPRNRTKNH